MTAPPIVRLLFAGLAAALLAGCATAPKPLRGEFAATSPSDASSAGRTGERVRWGGRIVSVDTGPERTCFELLGQPLRDDARPLSGDRSAGRFLACRPGFYDPALFAPGRLLTVTGTVEGFEERPIGEYRYRYPRVAADVLYLWPEIERVEVIDPFWGPAWPGFYPRPWGWGWRPYHYVPHRPPARRDDGDGKG